MFMSWMLGLIDVPLSFLLNAWEAVIVDYLPEFSEGLAAFFIGRYEGLAIRSANLHATNGHFYILLSGKDVLDGCKWLSLLLEPSGYFSFQEGVGLMAVNDAFLIEGSMYQLLRKHFRAQPYYAAVLDLFHLAVYRTEIGQCLDLLTSPSDSVDFSRFSMERYMAIVKYKTAFYSFQLPIALAMYMAGITDDKSHDIAKGILLEMGEFFQIQDDFLDCYGDPAVTGKVGTDIEENKCSWLVVQALDRASPEQKEILQSNYARNDPVCVAKVKEVFSELKLEQLYRSYEQESYDRLVATINQRTAETALPKAMFLEFANRIYKRKS